MALVTKSFSDIITFTRASTGTFFNSAGVLQSAAINAPRFDYNPATLAARGLLIEEQRTNLCLQSEDWGSATWSKSGSTITANATTAPTGTTVADKLVEDTSTGTHITTQTISLGGSVDNSAYVISVFAKASERTRFQLFDNAQASSGITSFDLSNGTVVSGTGTITAVGNGWYRCSVFPLKSTSITSTLTIRLISTGTTTSYTGDGTSGLFIWGAQLEAGAFPTSYIPTTTTALTRSADVASVNTLSPWYNQTEGTVYAELQSLSPLTSVQSVALNKYPHVWQIDAGATDSNPFWYGVGAELFIGGTYNNIGTVPSGINKFAVSLAASGGQSRSSLNGAAAVNRNGTLTGTATLFSLGKDSTNNVNNFLNGYLRRLTYYPRALSAAELQAITA